MQAKTSGSQESLPLLPGEEEALRESVVAGGPGTKSGKSLKMPSARTSPVPAVSSAPSPAKPAVRTAERPVAVCFKLSSVFVNFSPAKCFEISFNNQSGQC